MKVLDLTLCNPVLQCVLTGLMNLDFHGTDELGSHEAPGDATVLIPSIFFFIPLFK